MFRNKNKTRHYYCKICMSMSEADTATARQTLGVSLFDIIYIFSSEDILCKGFTELKEPHGVFSSSFNGVQSYVNNANCSWRIVAPKDQVS